MPQPCPAVSQDRIEPRARPARSLRTRRVVALAGATLLLAAGPADAQAATAAHAVTAAAAGTSAGGAAATATGDLAAAGGSAAAPVAGAVPAATSAAPSRATIRRAQRALRVTADGRLGPRTRAALRRFQRRHHLRADGRLHPATLVALGVTAGRAATATPVAATPSAKVMRLLEAIAVCESGGDPTRVSPGGRHRGKYQFLTATWAAVGGTGDPAAAPEAEQDQRAAALLAREGTKPWPVCGPKAEATT